MAIWKRGALEEAYKAGKLRAIGVSNFEKEDLANIIQNGTVLPAVNQILAHIGNMPFELIDYTKKQGVLVEAYSPIAHGEILSNESIAKDRRKIRRDRAAALYPLLPATWTSSPAQNGKHRTHEEQRESRLYHLRRRYGRARCTLCQRLRLVRHIPRFQRETDARRQLSGGRVQRKKNNKNEVYHEKKYL